MQLTRADQITAFEKKKAQPAETMQAVFLHVANGGHIFDLLEAWQVAYSDFMLWITEDEKRRELWNTAQNSQAEYVKREVLNTLRAISKFDVRQLFNEDGSLKPVSDWPAGAAFAVAGVDVAELWEGRGEDREQVGELKKVKLRDNLRALEMVGRNLNLFIEKVEHSHKITLEKLVTASLDQPETSYNIPEDKKRGTEAEGSPGVSQPRPPIRALTDSDQILEIIPDKEPGTISGTKNEKDIEKDIEKNSEKISGENPEDFPI